MFFRFDRRFNYLTVEDDFAHLKKIRKNGDLEFEFFYKVRASDAVQKGATTVEVTVFSRSVKRKSVLEGSHASHIDTRKLIKNIVTQVTDAKNASKQQEEFDLAHRKSDITAWLNNDALPALRARIPASSIPSFRRTSLHLVQAGELKQEAEKFPLYSNVSFNDQTDVYHVHSASLDENPTRLMYEMITKDGLDPSHIVSMTHSSMPSSDAIAGTLRPTRTRHTAYSAASRLMNYHVFPAGSIVRPTTSDDIDDSDFVQVLRSNSSDLVEVPIQIVVPHRRGFLSTNDSGNLFVRFDLIESSTGVAIDTVTRSLDTSRHIQLFNTPRKPPIVRVTRSEVSTRANIEIRQVDPGATAIRLYKKGVYTSVTDIDDYVLVGSYNVRSDQQSLLVQADMPRNSCAIYRVVSVGPQGNQSFEYSNVVVKPKRFSPIVSIALVAKAIDTGIRLEARQIPQKTVGVEFVRRNASTFESVFSNIVGGVILVDEQTRLADFVSFVDLTANPNHVYEYQVRLTLESGSRFDVGYACVEFLQPVPGKVDTRIEKLVVDQIGQPNVTFVMTTKIIDTNIDVVKSLLQRQDIYEMFKDDVTKEREFIKNLIAHNVQRIDLNTGKRDDFGVMTDSVFSDSEFRKNQAIQPIKAGHRYRYEVTPLLRSPETMFESLSKQKIDSVTKKSYSFSPAKFHHPITLSRGMIVSAQGLKTRFSKESMSHGAIGAVQSIEVSFDVPRSVVTDASAAKFDRYLNIVTWKVEGQVGQIDHFVIMKEVHGVRTVVGKTHSEFVHGNCQFLHQVTKRDVGSFVYVISPVFNDYRTGQPAKTNAVIVDNPSISSMRRFGIK